MDKSKKDRRVQRTLKLLKEAMIELIIEKGYDAVTVQDITDRANLGRATFYFHYKDKDELLMEMLDEVVNDLVDQIKQEPIEKWNFREIMPALMVFQYAQENADLYRIIMRGQGGMWVPRRLHEMVAEIITEMLEALAPKFGVKPKVPVDFLANYFAGSLLALITWWLENDTPYTAEEMVKMFRQVSWGGRAQVFGINPLQIGKQAK